MYRNCASRSGCCVPSRALALPCRLNPCSRSRSPTVSAPTLCPWAVSSAASARVDFTVHRNGEPGSPRSPGSTKASSAGTSPRSTSAAFLRPPPGRRARPSGSAPASSSFTPPDTLASPTPAAPKTRRRCRSSRCGKITPYFAASNSWVTSTRPLSHQRHQTGRTDTYFSAHTYHDLGWVRWVICPVYPTRARDITGSGWARHTFGPGAAHVRAGRGTRSGRARPGSNGGCGGLDWGRPEAGKWAAADRLGGMSTLVLLRHGESTWNSEGLFTSWVEVGLSENR